MASKRGNGEGSIYQRKDGRWVASAYLMMSDGVRKRIDVYGKTRQEVREKLVAAQAKDQQGLPTPSKNWRLAEYLDYWLEFGVRDKREPETYRRHEGVVRNHLKAALGRYTIIELSVMTVQSYVNRLATNGTPLPTIKNIHKTLSAALSYAERKELVMRNVAHRVELPKYKPDEGKAWSPDQVVHFLNAVRSDPLCPAFALLVLYGIREGEVLGLRWCDVGVELGVLHIRQQLQRVKGVGLIQKELKTRDSKRDEPLLAVAKEILAAQRAKQEVARIAAGSDWQGAGNELELVFTTRTGCPVEPRNLYRSFKRITRRENLPEIKVHELRHTNATIQMNLNVPGPDIQAVLGHSSMQTTRIYEHSNLDNKRNALEKVEQALYG